MYEHNKDKLLYGIVFYLLLTISANAFLWTLSANTAHTCS